jgi:3-hydroxyacyl-[acyl-carrier-protein] dehydratase
VLNIEDILRFLPHRYPFLLVDRVLELEKEKSIVALKNVTYNEEFFQGHFPGVRIMPGVLIVEAMAQAGGILLFHSVPSPEKKFVLFSKIEDMKFRRPVVPGDQIRIEARVTRAKKGFYFLHATAFVEGEIAAEGDMVASMSDRDKFYGRS